MIAEIKAKIGQACIVRSLADFNLKPTMVAVIDIETFGEKKKPGDAPYYENHGIAGISLGNSDGDAVYLVVNDGRDYHGIPIAQAINAVNAWIKSGVKILLAHYSKFDLGFLVKRGLDVSGVVLRDTWMSSNIKGGGVYTANKLKDIIRIKLGIETKTETAKDEALKAAGTEDYGDIDPQVTGTYACDDVRYSLLVFYTEDKMTVEEMACHDLYMRNNLHLIQAESRGICLNLPLLKDYLVKLETILKDDVSKIKDLLGAASINPEDEQEMLKYLHQKNLHPPPREMYGKVQFSCDRAYLWASDQPLAEAYASYDRRRCFMNNFSAMHGHMLPWVFSGADGQAGFHVQHLSSIFSKGGLTQCRKPDFTGPVPLENAIRALFIPRHGFEFVVIRAYDLYMTLLGFYCNNQELQDAVKTHSVLKMLANKADVKDTDVISVLLQQQVEGSGMGVLEQRMTRIKARFKGKQTLYALGDRFVACITGYKEMRERLSKNLADNGSVKDRGGRVLKIEKNKFYRAHSMLIQSSYGGILSYYLDIFCRLAAETKAHLVLAHDREFVFEVPAGDQVFKTAAVAATQAKLIEPVSVWEVSQGPVWLASCLDSHEEAGLEL